ncbi:MAG: hypothetical protein Q8Q20_04145 [bacterium]|nr:hypothetical protein [bacterium]
MTFRRYITPLLIIALVVMLSFPYMPTAHAANLTSISDTLTTLTQNVVANHTILFVSPTGVQASTDTITIDFTDFTIGSVDFTDIDLAEDDDGACDGSWTDKTLAATAAAGTWGAAIASSVLTLTPPTDAASGEIDAGFCVQIEIGTNAASGNAQFTNPNDTNTHVFEIDGDFGDDGRFALDFVTDDSVNITATVDASITFTISDTTTTFGSLSASTGRWATETGADASEITPDASHTMTLSTNATDGYAITYNGAELTSGADTICETEDVDCSSVSGDSDGTQGQEEFGISVSTDGDATIVTSYQRDATASFDFIPDATTSFISETGPTATETFTFSYLANIAGDTEAGSYESDITYIATATF